MHYCIQWCIHAMEYNIGIQSSKSNKLSFVYQKYSQLWGLIFVFYNGGMKYGRIFSQNGFLFWWVFELGRDNLEFLFVAVGGENFSLGGRQGGGVENFFTNFFLARFDDFP